MVLASAGRYLREMLTNIICIFSQRPFHLRHFLWHTNYPKYIDPSGLMTRVFSIVSGAHLGDLGTNPDLHRRQEETTTSIFSVSQRFPHEHTHHWWHANHQNCMPDLGTGAASTPAQVRSCWGSGHSVQRRSWQLPPLLLASHAVSSYPTPSPEANPHFWLRSIVQGCGRKHVVWSHFTQEELTRWQWGEQQCPAARSMVVQ